MMLSRKWVDRCTTRAQRIPVHLAPLLHERAEVDRAEVADVVRQQRLLAARIGGLVRPQVRHRIVVIRFVDEEDPRLAGPPGAVDDLVPNLARLELAGDLARSWDRCRSYIPSASTAAMNASVTATEMLKLVILRHVFLAGDELQDVRMVDAQNAHVGAAAGAALLDGLGGGVEQAHEGHRARRHAHGGAHDVVLGPEAGEAEAGAAAATGG